MGVSRRRRGIRQPVGLRRRLAGCTGAGAARQLSPGANGAHSLRDNWWCSFSIAADLDREGFWRFRAFGGEQPAVDPAPFLDAGQRAALGREWARLQQLETAPNHLAAIATAYAAARPGDARSPEALHLAVRATRFGCTDAGTGDRSRDAFRLLHRRWPDSPWTERSPYWFR